MTLKKLPANKTVIHDAIWKAYGLPIPCAEYLFASPRKWRFDYAWPHYKGKFIAVEIQGGLWTRGGHTRGKALLAEYEKLNAAQLAGWIVLLIVPEQIKDASAFELIRRALM